MKKGIDVSYAQGNIDFAKIDSNEVNFVIIRSSYGWEQGQKDSRFDSNIRGFHGRGIPCGAYHYAYAQNTHDAEKEAEYCLSCIGENQLELPVFYDMEDRSVARLGKRACTDIAKAFCGRMEQAGQKAGLYLNPNWLENYVYKEELIGKYELWLAQWGKSEPSYPCTVWQYTVGAAGCIRGIAGEVELNYMYAEPENKQEEEMPQAEPSEMPVRVTHTYTYIIRNGDTLTSIAEKYHTTVQRIIEENYLQDSGLIYSGRILYITV